MARVRLKVVAIAVLAGILAGIALYCAGARLRREIQTWRGRAEAALQASDSLEQVSDSLARLEAALRDTLARRRARVDTLRLAAESVLVHDTIKAAPLLAAALDACHAALSLTDTVISSCGRRAALERTRGDSLERVLAAGIPLIECRMLGLRIMPRCPSRTQSLLGGALLGLGGALLLRR